MGSTHAVAGSPRVSRTPLFAIFSLLLVWLSLLAGLVFLSANPVTVNLRQLAGCTSVVRVRVEDPALGRCTMLETVFGRPVVGELLISNLHATPAQPGHEYFIPISENRGQWEVTHLPASEVFPAEVLPLIYPADRFAEDQLEKAIDILSQPE